MENILKELQKLQFEITNAEKEQEEIIWSRDYSASEADEKHAELANKITENRQRMAEILLNEIPVNDVEAA